MKNLNFVLRLGLFSLILGLGTTAALLAGETTGLALADMSNVSVQAMTRAAAGNTLYAALGDDKHGIYRSEDSGRSWQKIGSGPAAHISAMAVHPANQQLLYAGTSGGQIADDSSLWFSRDKGRTWNRYGLGLPANPQGKLPVVTVLTVDPDYPGVLYVGTEGQGLYRVEPIGFSRVGGAALYNLYVNDVVAVPDAPVYAVTTEGLLAIEGDAWRKIEPLPDGVVSLAVDPANPNILYIGTVGYGAHRSTDGGQSWQPINRDLGLQPGLILRVSAITVDKDNPKHLALATALGVGSRLVPDGIYQSFDAGQSWLRRADSRELVNRLTIKEGGIYAATAKGLIRYGDPLSDLPAVSPLRFRTLIDSPTGMQSSILALTLVLAGLVLVGRTEWLGRHRQVKPVP
jgi:hypothetical protein